MKVLFWGTPAFALPALRALSEEGHDIVAVVTQPDRPAGRGRRLTASAVKEEALDEMIPVLQPERPHGPEFEAELGALAPEISVVVAYGQILRQEILDLPTRGSVNIHASLLPALRGAAPVHWAIIHGYQTTGVTIMQMEAGLDAGPVLHQVEEPIRPDESMSDLGMRLSEIGAEALIGTLTMMETGGIEAVPQDEERATYAPKVDRETAHLDWSLPAIEVGRWIRGLDAAPGAWSLLNGGESVKLFSPRVEVRSGEPGTVLDADQEVGVLIAAGHDAVRIREVQPQGKRRMAAGEWIRGRGVAVGDRFN
ncbi:MAG TPA: methionyl-tRNA formyltransferase [Longimicrobiaceae bacterium]|nr:methionyl-tRNA formyltransferase [Longimicrobiaceae bacterium]